MVFPNWEEELTEEKLKEQIARAKEAGRRANATESSAESVSYNKPDDMIVVRLTGGVVFSFPPKLAQGLADASPEQLSDIWISQSGRSIHWDSLGVDFSVPELIAGIFGTKSWMSELGRQGGKVKSKAKSAAARKNGNKGGRPKKKLAIA